MTTVPEPHPGRLDERSFRLAGIGAGPANLSLAAFLDTSQGRELDVFFEARRHFAWHPGMMLPEAEMQVHFLKDLVTPVDPTNPHSFLAYTVGRGEFYRLLNTRRHRLSRREFEAYCAWVASRLPTIHFGTDVLDVTFSDGFRISTTAGTYRADNLCVGVGPQPWLPECARSIDSPVVTHSAGFVYRPPPDTARRVVVVGGGQSGAEVVAHLLQRPSPSLGEIVWVSRRSTYLPLDQSPFVEDFFTPTASDAFFRQTPEARRQMLAEQRLASDGVSDNLLEKLYNRLYDIENGYIEGPSVVLTPATELVGIRVEDDGAIRMEWRHWQSGTTSASTADYVVFATGYQQVLAPALGSIADRFEFEGGGLRIRSDFSVVWDGPEASRIFVQNAARHVRGVADPNLSLVAWRAATIARLVAPDLVERLLDPHLKSGPLDARRLSVAPGQRRGPGHLILTAGVVSTGPGDGHPLQQTTNGTVEVEKS